MANRYEQNRETLLRRAACDTFWTYVSTTSAAFRFVLECCVILVMYRNVHWSVVVFAAAVTVRFQLQDFINWSKRQNEKQERELMRSMEGFVAPEDRQRVVEQIKRDIEESSRRKGFN